MKLKSLLVVDPVESMARHVARQCDRLAHERLVAITGQRALEIALAERPTMVILSLETQRPDAVEVVHELRHQLPQAFIAVTFRELAIPTMERLAKLGVDDFASHPINFVDIYRVASRHFDLPFRRHDRYPISLDVLRLDGVLLGRTRDLSEGGMLFDTAHPLSADESLLVDLALPDALSLRVRCHVLEVQGVAPSAVQMRVEFQNLRGAEQRRLVEFLSDLGRAYDEAGPSCAAAPEL